MDQAQASDAVGAWVVDGRITLLTLEDCLALCELTPEEVEAIAEHEHIPTIVAAELANYLVHTPNGVPMIRRMILDDMADAEKRGDELRVRQLRAVLLHFIATHPDRPQKS